MSLSVLDVSSGEVVTVPLEDDGLKTVRSVFPKIEKELGRVRGLSEDKRVMVTNMNIVGSEGCKRCSLDETVDYYLIDGCGWLVKTIIKTPLRQDQPGKVTVSMLGKNNTSIEVTGSLTVMGLKMKIESKEGIPRDQQRLYVLASDVKMYDGVEMDDDRTLEEHGIESDDRIRLARYITCENVVKKPLCQDHVIVKTLTGLTISVKVTANLTVMDLKARIQDKEGIPPDQQRLMIHGVQMEDDWTLEECGIGPDDNIHLVLRLRGGCAPAFVEFADVSRADSLKRKGWSKSAPAWRIAHPGLCLEGVCQNEKCSANGEHVIMNHSYCEFDLIEDRRKCECPICHKQVIPTTCGFNNCRWKWVGRKIDQQTQRPVTIRADWKVADDAYHYFDETKSGTANWLRLKITTKQASDVKSWLIICAICLDYAVGATETDTLPCGHTFHGKCISEWLKRSSTCPLCRARSIMTPFMREAAGL